MCVFCTFKFKSIIWHFNPINIISQTVKKSKVIIEKKVKMHKKTEKHPLLCKK